MRRSVRLAACIGALALVAVAATSAGLWMKSKTAPNVAAQSVSSIEPFSAVAVPSRGATNVALGAPVNVTVVGGHLTSVTMTDGAGQAVAGQMAPDARSWAAPIGALSPGTSYWIHYDATDGTNPPVARSTWFKTQTPTSLKTDVTPFGDQTVGVAMPIVVRFNHPVANRDAVQSALQVSMSVPVLGAWHWFGDQEVHFRPQAYWPSGEAVVVGVNLAGIYAGHGVWGTTDRNVTFKVGAAHISVADVVTHSMVVTDSGKVVRTMPISAGRVDLPTMGGIHWVLDKEPSVLMDSATVGIPKGSPDYYYETVYQDVHISTTGEYVHSAPWSVASQGQQNVSHGCVNLSPTDAAWFYNFTQPGDVVSVVGSPRAPDLTVGGVADWNMSWAQWTAGA